MPRIFDNIELPLIKALQDTLELSHRADFCVGYFNLRGWKLIDSYIDNWIGGDISYCRLMIGMNPPPQDQLRAALNILATETEIDNQQAARIRRQIAEEFRDQLVRGAPTNQDEIGLRKLSAQLVTFGIIWHSFLIIICQFTHQIFRIICQS